VGLHGGQRENAAKREVEQRADDVIDPKPTGP
jgi:hypothetical protein